MRPAVDLKICQVCGRDPWHVATVAARYGEADTYHGGGRGWLVKLDARPQVMIGTCGEETCIRRARRFISPES